ncbi:ATP-binding cassette domain-containing protein [Staphylococcus pseudintermedius]|nr:ATP-binding cassette domain-containing protein [Staphylococcus pseudintermedius]
MSILTLKNIRCEMDGKLLFEADGLTIEEGDVIGLIGKNGAGKTCLLKILAGELSDYAGYISGNRLTYFSELCITEDMTQSGGELSISSFLNALRQSVPLYLLDEPTTYLDQHHLKKVVRTIRRSPSSFCIASHDRAFLDAVATKIWLLEQGKITEYNGSFSDYVLARSMQLSQYEQELKQYQKEKKKIKQSLRMMKEKQDQKKGKPKKMSTSEYRIAGIKTKYGVKQKSYRSVLHDNKKS